MGVTSLFPPAFQFLKALLIFPGAPKGTAVGRSRRIVYSIGTLQSSFVVEESQVIHNLFAAREADSLGISPWRWATHTEAFQTQSTDP